MLVTTSTTVNATEKRDALRVNRELPAQTGSDFAGDFAGVLDIFGI
jgi:hypothetical protein